MTYTTHKCQNINSYSRNPKQLHKDKHSFFNQITQGNVFSPSANIFLTLKVMADNTDLLHTDSSQQLESQKIDVKKALGYYLAFSLFADKNRYS